VRDHLLVGELVAVGALDDAVEEEDRAEGLRLDDRDVLRAGGGRRWLARGGGGGGAMGAAARGLQI
jgi:hypothetical protein